LEYDYLKRFSSELEEDKKRLTVKLDDAMKYKDESTERKYEIRTKM